MGRKWMDGLRVAVVMDTVAGPKGEARQLDTPLSSSSLPLSASFSSALSAFSIAWFLISLAVCCSSAAQEHTASQEQLIRTSCDAAATADCGMVPWCRSQSVASRNAPASSSSFAARSLLILAVSCSSAAQRQARRMSQQQSASVQLSRCHSGLLRMLP